MDRAEGLLRAGEGTATKRAATVMVEEVKFGYIYIYLESICIDREREREVNRKWLGLLFTVHYIKTLFEHEDKMVSIKWHLVNIQSSFLQVHYFFWQRNTVVDSVGRFTEVNHTDKKQVMSWWQTKNSGSKKSVGWIVGWVGWMTEWPCKSQV